MKKETTIPFVTNVEKLLINSPKHELHFMGAVPANTWFELLQPCFGLDDKNANHKVVAHHLVGGFFELLTILMSVPPGLNMGLEQHSAAKTIQNALKSIQELLHDNDLQLDIHRFRSTLHIMLLIMRSDAISHQDYYWVSESFHWTNYIHSCFITARVHFPLGRLVIELDATLALVYPKYHAGPVLGSTLASSVPSNPITPTTSPSVPTVAYTSCPESTYALCPSSQYPIFFQDLAAQRPAVLVNYKFDHHRESKPTNDADLYGLNGQERMRMMENATRVESIFPFEPRDNGHQAIVFFKRALSVYNKWQAPNYLPILFMWLDNCFLNTSMYSGYCAYLADEHMLAAPITTRAAWLLCSLIDFLHQFSAQADVRWRTTPKTPGPMHRFLSDMYQNFMNSRFNTPTNYDLTNTLIVHFQSRLTQAESEMLRGAFDNTVWNSYSALIDHLKRRDYIISAPQAQFKGVQMTPPTAMNTKKRFKPDTESAPPCHNPIHPPDTCPDRSCLDYHVWVLRSRTVCGACFTSGHSLKYCQNTYAFPQLRCTFCGSFNFGRYALTHEKCAETHRDISCNICNEKGHRALAHHNPLRRHSS
jgi:hypothetical protein